jgi:hypothetical protein
LARNDKSLPAHATELWELVVAYLKQETIGPIKELGRFVAMGVAGSVLLAVGLPLLVLSLLRALQAETGESLTGNLTWVPYLGALGLSLLFAGLAVLGMNRTKNRRNKGKG